MHPNWFQRFHPVPGTTRTRTGSGFQPIGVWNLEPVPPGSSRGAGHPYGVLPLHRSRLLRRGTGWAS